jgi:hypothetical protein
MAKKKTAKKGKRMAMGGLGMDDSAMRSTPMLGGGPIQKRPIGPTPIPGRGLGREMERDEADDDMEYSRERGGLEDGMRRGREREMERRMRRGRDREMERGMKRGGMDGYRRPEIGGGLPPVQTMGPGNMPASPAPKTPAAPPSMPLAAPAALGKMPNSGMGAPAAPTQSGAQQGMMRNMGPNNMQPLKMRGGGIARKGKGLTMAKGGLVKGCGCVSKGVKTPRYT